MILFFLLGDVENITENIRQKENYFTDHHRGGLDYYHGLSEEQKKTDVKKLSTYTCDYMFPGIEYYGWWEQE